MSLFISLAITIIREGVLQLPIGFYERLMRQGCVTILEIFALYSTPLFRFSFAILHSETQQDN